MTIELVDRCGVCRSYLDEDDLFCSNCGTENPIACSSSQPLEHTANHHSFTCQSCGASMSYDASAQALRCPFCGSTEMTKRQSARSVTPDVVVPFRIDKQRASAILKEWLGRGFWKPTDAARASQIGEITAVYVPYWMFEAQTDTRWTADSSATPPGARSDWFPVSGRNTASYSGVLVGGSSILTARETESIAPFGLQGAVKPEQLDLLNAISEDFKVPRKLARPLARAAVEELERQTVESRVPGRARNLRVNVRLSAMHGVPVLLPIWILAYRYKKNVHRVLINGQSGKIDGSAPFAYGKLTAVVALAIALLAVIAVIALLANA